MKQHIENLLQTALRSLQKTGKLTVIPVFVQVETIRDKHFGDLTTNVAMMLARPIGKDPLDIAQLIIDALPASPYVEKVSAAGAGFINFQLSFPALLDIIPAILSEKDNFGLCKIGREKRVLVEFVSSNPTGPLKINQGRHAVFGAVLSNLLDAVGFKTYREYYVNDIGRPIDIVTVSVWLFYLQLCGETIDIPAHAYNSDDITNIARILKEQHLNAFHVPAEQIVNALPPETKQPGGQERFMDKLITRAKLLLGYQYQVITDNALDYLLNHIAVDLSALGIHFDNWYSERKLVASGEVDTLLQKMRHRGYTYERDGALWFRSTAFGDTKDRVLVHPNGECSYFANDAAYHLNKFERGFDLAMDIFGADHQGYAERMQAAMEVCGINPERLLPLFIQPTILYQHKKQTLSPTPVRDALTLRALCDEVGNDAVRFFYLMRKYDHPLDFDLTLATSVSNDNPIYYIQYAYTRIASVFKQANERHLPYQEQNGLQHLSLLVQKEERHLLNTLTRYSDIIVQAALQYEPQLLTTYVRELASDFHCYYNAHQFLVEDANLRDARLALIAAVSQVLLNSFNLLGITAPETM